MLALAALGLLLGRAESILYAQHWFLLAAVVLAFELWQVWRALPLNHREGENEVLPTFGPGNGLSLARGTLIALLAGFLLLPRPEEMLAWLPAALYILADFTDFFDGYLARRSNMVTRLGERLDMNHDALGVMVATLLAFQYGTVPWWYAVFGFARYFFVFGLWQRRRRGLPVFDLPPNPSRRGFAALQMGFVTAMLFPILQPPGTTVAATLFMLPFIAGFGYDWLHVSGRLGAPAPEATRRGRQVWQVLRDFIPLGLRMVAVGVFLYWFKEQAGLAPPWGWLEWICAAALALGWAARFFSVTALLLLGGRFAAFGTDTAGWLLLAAGVGLIFLGPGKWYLWGPEEWFVHNRAGERRDS